MALTVPNPINNVTPKNLLYTSGNGGSAFITSDITGTVQFCVKNNYVSTSISGQVTVVSRSAMICRESIADPSSQKAAE